MVVALPHEKKISIYTSSNLINWKHQSDFGPLGGVGGAWECPDLIQLPIVNNPTKKAWVMIVSLNPGGLYGGSGTQYFVGEFNGQEFISNEGSEKINWLDYGQDNYAGVTFNNAPDNRTVLIGWMSSWIYAGSLSNSPWTGAMTIPRELSLNKLGDSLTLVSQPIKEFDALQNEELFFSANLKMKDRGLLREVTGKELDITLSFSPGESGKSGINVLVGDVESTQVGYDADLGEVFLNRVASSESSAAENMLQILKAPVGTLSSLKLRILVDRSSVEIFVNDGEFVLTGVVFPHSEQSEGISIFADNHEAEILDISVSSLKSVWR